MHKTCTLAVIIFPVLKSNIVESLYVDLSQETQQLNYSPKLKHLLSGKKPQEPDPDSISMGIPVYLHKISQNNKILLPACIYRFFLFMV